MASNRNDILVALALQNQFTCCCFTQEETKQTSYLGSTIVGGGVEVGWAVPFLSAINFPSVSTRYPFAAGWTVSKHSSFGSRVQLEPPMFRSAVKRSNHLTKMCKCAL